MKRTAVIFRASWEAPVSRTEAGESISFAFLIMMYKRRIKLQTFPYPLCGSPNRIEHDGSLLLIPGVCKDCGKRAEFNNQRTLFWTIIGGEL